MTYHSDHVFGKIITYVYRTEGNMVIYISRFILFKSSIGYSVCYFTVSEFAKLTGDFRSLSAVDLRVLALTYQLEKEHCGIDHIKKRPTKQVRTCLTFVLFTLRTLTCLVNLLAGDKKSYL